MNYHEFIEKENEAYLERFELSMERILQITKEECTMNAPYAVYFKKAAAFFMEIRDICILVKENRLKSLSIKELELQNKQLYSDIFAESYNNSYANPAYAVKELGDVYGQMLSFLYTQIRGCIAYSYEMRIFDLTITAELFIEIYNLFEEEDENTFKSVKSAIYYFMSDYSDVTLTKRMRELFDPQLSFALDIIMKEDLEDLKYLYYYGEYITENELKTARFLNAMPQDKIDSMAATFTQGYKKGFENYRMDLSSKEVVNIRYVLGFERMVKAAVKQFEEMGLKTAIYRIGIHGTRANKQFEYDHRFDDALYLDKAYNERRLAVSKVAYESMKDMAGKFAGPAVIIAFGEANFQPINSDKSLTLSKKQQKLRVEYQRDIGILSNNYIKNDETSFTIIAYPIPEIGENFEEIFSETVKVNTLDMKRYETMQSLIIDALDQGEYVTVTGRGKNRTNLCIQLPELKNPEKETNFENCVADVNIPVGEVFTSPKLAGTNGVLHVTQVYLGKLNFIDLELTFEDGKIASYSCGNFETEEENMNYVKENVLFQHDTLPMGEFAIGTNTTAYAMAKKYEISALLPILIAEKTGPHFAVGDTCFHMSEDMVTFNPDGKEMVAKDNECSILRKTDLENAYFNCHTDITIPYHELGDIVVHKANKETIAIIREGRFVLQGCEELNEVL